MDFTIQRMANPSRENIAADIRRVDKLLNVTVLTSAAYHKHSRVSHGTLLKHFGTWHAALCEAGLGHKSNRKSKTKKLAEQRSKRMTDAEIIEELQLVARKLNQDTLTTEDLDRHSDKISASTIRNRLGWHKGLRRAGLKISSHGRRYSDDECFDNLVNVWTHYGRPPKARQMARPPSVIGPKAYTSRWGGWLKAIEAFVRDIDRGTDSHSTEAATESSPAVKRPIEARSRPQDRRHIPYRLRYRVLLRDNFKCVIDGSNPATDPACKLHVDHLIPWSKGGQTVLENLRTLCERCNLGKGDLTEEYT